MSLDSAKWPNHQRISNVVRVYYCLNWRRGEKFKGKWKCFRQVHECAELHRAVITRRNISFNCLPACEHWQDIQLCTKVMTRTLMDAVCGFVRKFTLDNVRHCFNALRKIWASWNACISCFVKWHLVRSFSYEISITNESAISLPECANIRFS